MRLNPSATLIGNFNLIYVKTDSLSNFDLLEWLTINNASHVVRAESRIGLIGAANRAAAKEENTGNLGIPYFVYRHDIPHFSEGPQFRVVPVKTKYYTITTFPKAYKKDEILGRFAHVTEASATRDDTIDEIAGIGTLDEAWPSLSEQMRQFLFKVAKNEYRGKIQLNLEKFNEKCARAHTLFQTDGITQTDIEQGLTFERLPLVEELEKYQNEVRTSNLDFLNRTRATASSYAPSEEARSVAQQENQETNPTTLPQPSRDPSYYDEFIDDDADYPNPPPLRIQDEDVIPNRRRTQVESTPLPRRNEAQESADDTPLIQRVTEEVHTTRHRAAASPEPIENFIQNEIQNDGIRTPVSVTRNPTQSPIGAERQNQAQRDPAALNSVNDQQYLDNLLTNENLDQEDRQDNRQVAFEENDCQTRMPRSRSPRRSAMRNTSTERRTRRANSNSTSRGRSPSTGRLRTMREERRYEFGARQINYSIYDHRDQDQTPTEFFKNFRVEVSTNLKKGTVFDIPVKIIVQLAKSCIKSKEKQKAFVREVAKKEPRNISEVQQCFAEAMTVSTQLRKTRFNAIKKKPSNENWTDFAQKFEKQFEICQRCENIL